MSMQLATANPRLPSGEAIMPNPPTPEEARAKLIAQGVGIFLALAVAIGISQFPIGASLMWGALIIVIVVMLLWNTDKLLGLAGTLQGK